MIFSKANGSPDSSVLRRDDQVFRQIRRFSDIPCLIFEIRAFAHFVSCSLWEAGSKLQSERRPQDMDLKKTGKLLQELRKEKGLTQEQLAEQTGVARRTVSRWETGSNMPDLDILIELSDLYNVDLREILSGERKSERMNEELKETVLQVADYSSEEKARLLRRLHWLFITGLLGFAAFLIITLLDLDHTAPYEMIGSFGLGIAFGMIIIGVIFTGRYAAKIREFKLRLLGKLK